MKYKKTKLGIYVFLLLVCNVLNANEEPDKMKSFEKKWTSATHDYVKEELQSVKMPFYPKYSSGIKRWIKRHITRGGASFEVMLGKAKYYFPIFEYHLEKAGLPKELKYLAMVESGLYPTIESPVGAVGLWQFMPQTARHYKLQINEYVDERRDPYRATESAVKLLGDLYKQFKDWELVLAAYNCGPGRVRRAIRAAGSKDYNRIKGYLPKQTREYLIKYVASTFVGEKHRILGLKPRKVMIEHSETSVLKVYDWISFTGVSKACEISIKTIKTLNPSYLKGIIPKSEAGNYFILPGTVALKFEKYLKSNGLTRFEYIFGEPERPEPEMHYWVSASVHPRNSRKKFNWSMHGVIEWGTFWGRSLLTSLKMSNFLSL